MPDRDNESGLISEYEDIWTEILKGEKYDELIAHRYEDRIPFYKAIAASLSGGKGRQSILELGCGTAVDLNIIAKENKNVSCFGSDISPKSILLSKEISKSFGNGINYFIADTLSLPLRTGAFDLVFSQGLIEHFSDPASVIRENARVLKTGGTLVVNVPQKFTGYTLVKRWRMHRKRWHLGWETEFSYCRLKKLGESAGLREKTVFGYQYWKSWKEPLFVLRDLYNKVHRRNPYRTMKLFLILKQNYDAFWNHIEKRWGHHFLQNIVTVFEKQY
jgi:SAM-dependent methyltransferase